MNTTRGISAYRQHAAHTASKTQIVVMLAARMTSDIAQAITNIEKHNPAAAHELLVHAQQVVDELSTALDVDTCPAGNELRSLYQFITDELIEANIQKSTQHASNAHRVAEEISAMFAVAAQEQAA
jgi:flagellar protein FliS